MPYKDKDKRLAYFRQYNLSRQEQQTEYNQQYYQANPDHFVQNARKREQRTRDFIQQLKKGLSCKRCGIDDWRVLDFHHIDGQMKEFSIAKATRRGFSRERILQEIAKCEVLCSNCHRILHWEENYG